MKMARPLAEILVLGVKIVGRAFVRTLEQEIASSQAAAAAMRGKRIESSEKVALNNTTGITLEEAMQILNVAKLEAEQVKKNYEHLFPMNDKGKDGSFYLLSKIVRAKERLYSEINMKNENSAIP